LGERQAFRTPPLSDEMANGLQVLTLPAYEFALKQFSDWMILTGSDRSPIS
jgi:hypothetical protein